MKFLLDTNVVSELIKPEPEQSVLDWFSSCPENKMYISSLTLGEIEMGITCVGSGKHQNQLLLWFASLQNSFEGKVFSVDSITAIRWGEIRGNLKLKGITLPVIDGLIAASAITNNAILVTRNSKDFDFPRDRNTQPLDIKRSNRD